MKENNAAAWVEALRLRTLPVSVAGVLAGVAVGAAFAPVRWIPAVICLVFALLAQIVSNFANEYFDFKGGLDKKGREGFRRGVTEGDIRPDAMLRATVSLLAFDCLLGLSLVYWGGWWLLAVGVAIAVFALAYSTGPYPLSHHGLGDVAVVVFFGVVPVMLTAYLQTGSWWTATPAASGRFVELWQMAFPVSLGIGMLADNVLIVNNVRDIEDDREVGKHTTAVIFGRRAMTTVYGIFCFGGIALTFLPVMWLIGGYLKWIWLLLFIPAAMIYREMRVRSGAALNAVLKFTALLLLGSVMVFVAILAIAGKFA